MLTGVFLFEGLDRAGRVHFKKTILLLDGLFEGLANNGYTSVLKVLFLF